jgi:chromosome segregation ATPase
MRNREMRLLSARNSGLNNTMPVPIDTEVFNMSKRKSVDYGIRGKSINRHEKLTESQDLDAYTELKDLYEKALSENCTLKSENYHESSLSTVKLERDTTVKLSLIKEIEELQGVLSKTSESIKILKEYQKELVDNRNQAKKDLEEQRNMHSFAKDNMLSLLQGKLNNSVDMLKTVYREKKNLEAFLDKEEKTKHMLQGQSAALEEKIKVLEGKNKDLQTSSTLNAQISSVISKQDAINKKIDKYESYIQSKNKKSN